ncbi:hypothetical protein G7081_00500 [Vagococcus coleopterorum]|uniref:Energy-coupling factor transport system permease protein n=1 Tax=Vagococcus coleopterorum TaxID=2714946 RepID=A0A6G8AL35_9ENTE|nr:energy-coupling factor transporter transmembrane component T [Vagococcus coleopterorum]QIL45672.1 hypothetical protein G7081_00500 [Vagococcus coleopterorum]
MRSAVIKLDVRCKLGLVLLASLLLFFGQHLAHRQVKELVFVVGLLGLLAANRRYHSVKIYGTLYVVLALISFLPTLLSGHLLVERFAAFAYGGMRMYPGLLAGGVLVHSSTTSELFQAFDQLHISRRVAIPFVTMLRFIPHFAEEYKKVIKMFRLRWRSLPVAKRFNPGLYALPILNTALKSADDLAKSAYTRGLKIEGERHYYQPNQWRMIDTVVMVVACLVLVF